MKTMNYVDGPGPIEVGQEVVYIDNYNREIKTRVHTIGTKWVVLEDYSAFNLNTGVMRTEGGMSIRLYSSVEAKRTHDEQRKSIKSVIEWFRINEPNYVQACSIWEIIKPK